MTGRGVFGLIAAVVVAAAAGGANATPADAAVSVRVTSVRVVDAQTRRPATLPLRRSREYSYVIRYRIAGERMIRVTRRAEIQTLRGAVMARVRPPATFDEPGRYFATSRILIGPRDPQGTYWLRYQIVVRGKKAVARVTRRTPLPFR